VDCGSAARFALLTRALPDDSPFADRLAAMPGEDEIADDGLGAFAGSRGFQPRWLFHVCGNLL